MNRVNELSKKSLNGLFVTIGYKVGCIHDYDDIADN